MKVSLSWLKQYVDVDMEPGALADALTMVGLEVDSVSDRYEYLESILVSRIIDISQHSQAADLKICQVDIGGRVIPVVCGAPNVKKGMLAPCALPGTSLPSGIVLQKEQIRGAPSEGMLCSEIELGLGTNADGIVVLSQNFAVGESLNKALELSDAVFEIDLTPNRADCLSIIGAAREIAAFKRTKVRYPQINLPKSFDDISNYTSVAILDPDLCPRYAAMLLFDVTVGPSPFWLQDRLISVGLKPINNIVDATNFIMMETGQPLHAFDFDRLAENRIVVRVAQEGETFTTLDQKDRRLDSEMLMICDGEKSVAIGGVMGGLNSEVEETTTRVLLESAYFDPVSIRKTSKKTGLNTDASHRFERGVDPQGTITALHRVAQLIVEVSGGKLISGTIDENPKPIPDKTVDLSVKALNRHLGIRLDRNEVETYLKSIEFDIERIDNDRLRIFPPSCRVDISRFEDLTEEVARLMGYDNIETTFPLIPADTRKVSKRIDIRNRIKGMMTGLGFSEAINYSFISRLSCDHLEIRSDDSRRQVVEILNPLAEDQSVMRTSLIPGLLDTMHYNLAVQNLNLKLFEVGNVFFNTGKADSRPAEIEMLAGLWTGIRNDPFWPAKETYCDFYDLKGVVEELLGSLNIDEATFTHLPPELCRYTKAGYTAQIIIADETLGLVGELHPKVLSNYDLKQTAFIFELNFDQLLKHIPDLKPAKPIPKFPSTARDITLIVAHNVEALKILKSIETFKEDLVEDTNLLDVFEGDPIPLGQKSISFRITYRSYHETLEDDKVNRIHKKIADRLLKEFDATLPA